MRSVRDKLEGLESASLLIWAVAISLLPESSSHICGPLRFNISVRTQSLDTTIAMSHQSPCANLEGYD
jgi:hypothetical protein